MYTLEQRIVRIIGEHLGVDEEKINESSILRDLGADSLDSVELVMAMEEEFNIEINDDQLDSIKMVSDVIAIVYENS